MLIRREKKTLTFMIIPHNSNSVFNVQISYKVVYVAAVILVVGLTAVFNLSWNYKKHNQTLAELNRTQREKAQITAEKEKVEANLEGEVEDLQQDAKTLEKQLNEMEKQTEELGNIIGVDKEKISENIRQRERRVSMGSGVVSRNMTPELYSIRRSISQIQSETRVQIETLKQLQSIAEEKKSKLDHIPSLRPMKGRISSGFGWRRNPISGRSEFHQALDIIGNYGDPIHVTADGTVVSSSYEGGYGNMVVVNHGNGIVTKYAHNSRILVVPGQKVKKGDKIALAGATGYTTGVHVHYELWRNGAAVDPTPFLDVNLKDVEY